jgi:peptidoglycan hydrolase-like protein with peptidoglycan-binding domain
VKKLQTALNRLGFSCGEADGDFGPKTEDAVKRFQKAHGLDADGEFGPFSYAALKHVYEWGRVNG